ncbi:hypothetical protein HDU79_011201, partial [Rhizoclosmatium sp. JEL0117]
MTIVLIYVDDILIASNSHDAIQMVKDLLKSKFTITENDNANWILKVQIERINGGIWIGQPNYATEVLKEA